MAQLLRIRATARVDAIRPILYRGGLEWLCLAVRFGQKRKSRAKGRTFLQSHDQIKKFHSPADGKAVANRWRMALFYLIDSPADGKAVANVTAEHGIHRRWNLQKLGRR